MALGFARPARAGDAGEIARIQLETWRLAYRKLIPREILAGLDAEQMAAQWLAAITEPPTPRHRVLVAVEQSEAGAETTVGFAAIGPAEEEDKAEGAGAFTELLVEPRWGRRGHGSRLLSAAVDLWRTDGYETALAWVFDQAPAPRKFLTSAGWEADGARRSLDMADILVPQVRLHTAL
ncbi:GNAT family N-acetyltransferase [Longispora albida]|uniref:GNAT family N-acetyltransferase n=1 Tax=Longispora albida TaxID=203523 RepID=UPI000362674A|nr:GNAT family N-acetyltransferase [Longispora albida]